MNRIPDSCTKAAVKAHQFQPSTPTHTQERIGLRCDPQVYPCAYVRTHRRLTTHALLTLFNNVDDQHIEHSRSSGICVSAFSRIKPAAACTLSCLRIVFRPARRKTIYKN